MLRYNMLTFEQQRKNKNRSVFSGILMRFVYISVYIWLKFVEMTLKIYVFGNWRDSTAGRVDMGLIPSGMIPEYKVSPKHCQV